MRRKKVNVAKLSAGEFTHTLIQHHMVTMAECEPTLSLDDPSTDALLALQKALQQWCATLTLLEDAIDLPKFADSDLIQMLLERVDDLIDIDRQLTVLRSHQQQNLPQEDQAALVTCIGRLLRKREKAWTDVQSEFAKPRYGLMKHAYQTWIEEAKFTAMGERSLMLVLPDLLQLRMTKYLLHSGWFVAAEDQSKAALRKRYHLKGFTHSLSHQLETIQQSVGANLKALDQELTNVMTTLGALYDGQMVLRFLKKSIPRVVESPHFQQVIEAEQAKILSQWKELQQHYLSSEIRHSVRQKVLLEELNP